MLATDLADYLVISKGIPFREAHGIVASICNYAIKQNKHLSELTIDEYRDFSVRIGFWIIFKAFPSVILLNFENFFMIIF